MVRRTLALFVALLAVAALGAAPAHAGGPTSVVLSSPPNVVAVGYDDKQYAELQRLTEASGARDPVGKENHESGQVVRATWLIHDMSVWRIDIIYPDAPGGPWIATRASMDGSTLPEKPTWHTANDRVGLLKLLHSMNLLSGQTNGDSSWGGPTFLGSEGSSSSEAPAEEAAPPAQAQVASTSVFTGWRWTIPGFLLGAVIAVIAVRFLPKRRDWQLVDAE
ncbi:hypothetical protein ACGFIF_05465 [Kribbella sp. NPDC049174]|uniref:hypothetical protein n=1 Tax=Kribbella sp. NPDC049174 TaxID=3364112 RepID=UPI0037168F9F